MLLLDEGENRDAAIEANRQGWSAERFRTQFLIGGVDEVSERIQRLIDVGIEYVIVYIPRVAYDHTPMMRFAREVLPQFV
jgi:alkanesulfonate monooxygenase SsuD/methylene tetrahydromethanopterin reductase-like flavin-dependent oxidoreductase (luciferase family)